MKIFFTTVWLALLLAVVLLLLPGCAGIPTAPCDPASVPAPAVKQEQSQASTWWDYINKLLVK